jgi:hypothetical protein
MSNDLGIDRSGNNNSWTVNNMAFADQMVDSPTNNFSTLNPLAPRSGYDVDLSEGNLRQRQDIYESTQSTFQVSSGKWYMEVNYADYQYGLYAGINQSDNASRGDWTYSIMYGSTGDANVSAYNLWTSSWGDAYNTDGSIIGIAVNFDDNEVKFYKNGVLQGTISDRLVTDGSVSYGMFLSDGRNSDIYIANFGQDSSFAGTKTAQGNQDSNGIGDFYYTPTSGHLALCTSNLPAVAVIPSEHFNTVLYTGTGATRSITGLGFQPDFVWLKERNNAISHRLFDSVRGATKRMFSNNDGAESIHTPSLTSFDSDGFSLGDGTSVNESSDTYVAWNWKAGNATLGTGDFTQGSIASTCSRNVDAGFSIVSYTGNGSAGQTIGHGLSKAPEMMLIKNRSDADNWVVFVNAGSMDETDKLRLDTTMALVDDVDAWNDTAPTATVFTVDTDNQNNGSGNTHIAYCFHSVDGYSKVGTHVSNNSADGTFIYTGFRPAFILNKSTSISSWWMMDSVRSTYNEVGHLIKGQDSVVEISSASGIGVDFLSNGFKLTKPDASGYMNPAAQTFVWIAFAETPFKYSNAR